MQIGVALSCLAQGRQDIADLLWDCDIQQVERVISIVKYVNGSGDRHRADQDFLELVRLLAEKRTLDPRRFDRVDLFIEVLDSPVREPVLWDSLNVATLNSYRSMVQLSPNQDLARFFADSLPGSVSIIDMDTGRALQGSPQSAQYAAANSIDEWFKANHYDYHIPEELERYLSVLKQQGYLPDFSYRALDFKGRIVQMRVRACIAWWGDRRVRFVEALEPPRLLS